jgi:predicted dehydrogenase
MTPPNSAAQTETPKNKNPKARMRVAVIGTGRISKFHFEAWKAIEGADVVAVCDVNADRARSRAEQYGVPAVYSSLAELLDKEEIDGLDIAAPSRAHGEILRLAAARKMPCLCQKPLGKDYAEAKAIITEVAPKTLLMINENRRYLPYFSAAREWIAQGLLGDIRDATLTAYRSQFLPGPDGKYTGTAAIVVGPRLYVNEGMIHQIDVMRSLLGPMHVIACRMLHTGAGLEGDTVCTLFMETKAGAPVVIAGNNVAIGYTDRFNDKVEIHGSKASLIWDGTVLRLLGPEPKEIAFDTKDKYDEIYQSCFTSAARIFRNAVMDGGSFETTGPDNLETLEIVEEAYRLGNPLRKGA